MKKEAYVIRKKSKDPDAAAEPKQKKPKVRQKKMNDLRDMTDTELIETLGNLSLDKMKILGNNERGIINSPGELHKTKRMIAQIKTIQNQRKQAAASA